MILHVDMDAFFVSVEELYDPSLKGKPVVVGAALEWRDGRPVAPRGVVAAASYAARKFGVHSAMPLATALKLCPQAIFVPGHRQRYAEASGRIQEIFRRFSPQVEMVSIDEGYLDLAGTERLHGPPFRTAAALHDAIAAEIRLPCSIGVSASRLVSKVASDQAKPNGLLWIPAGAEAAFLAPLPVRKVPGIGKVSERRLAAKGVRTVADAAAAGPEMLESVLGVNGAALFHKAHGEDAGAWFTGRVGDQAGAKSISHETTFAEDTRDEALLHATLSELSQMVARRLRDSGVFTRTVQLKLRTSDFHTITRATTLGQPTNLDSELYAEIKSLFDNAWTRLAPARRKAVRLVGVHAGGLESSPGQLHLLEQDRRQKWDRAMAAADRLRDRFGFSSVQLGGALRDDGTPAMPTERVHENPAGFRKKQ
jgi:DNA polymerase-4